MENNGIQPAQIQPEEVRIELTALASMEKAKSWAKSLSFLDGCTDEENRWFFAGREECWLIVKIQPRQIAGIRRAACKAGMNAENAMAMTVAEVIEAVLAEELNKVQ